MSSTTCLISRSDPWEGDVPANALLRLGGKSMDAAVDAAMTAADPSRRRRVNLGESESLSAKGKEVPFLLASGEKSDAERWPPEH
jgi:hypothetical protein